MPRDLREDLSFIARHTMMTYYILYDIPYIYEYNIYALYRNSQVTIDFPISQIKLSTLFYENVLTLINKSSKT